MKRRELARFGEDLAADYLEKKGYTILERNFRKRYGELDIITLNPTGKRLVVVEVKTRYLNARVSPKEAVTKKKIAQLKNATLYYKKKNKGKIPDSLRIDVVAIQLERDDSVSTLEHIRNITQL